MKKRSQNKPKNQFKLSVIQSKRLVLIENYIMDTDVNFMY